MMHVSSGSVNNLPTSSCRKCTQPDVRTLQSDRREPSTRGVFCGRVCRAADGGRACRRFVQHRCVKQRNIIQIHNFHCNHVTSTSYINDYEFEQSGYTCACNKILLLVLMRKQQNAIVFPILTAALQCYIASHSTSALYELGRP